MRSAAGGAGEGGLQAVDATSAGNVGGGRQAVADASGHGAAANGGSQPGRSGAGTTGTISGNIQGTAGQTGSGNVGLSAGTGSISTIPTIPTAGGSGGSMNVAGTRGAAACIGKGGIAVCDAAGHLVVCNADETIAMEQSCSSPQLCQAGAATKTCAMCVPKEDYRCTGKTLEVCADDGQSFMMKQDCDTEALCNPTAGMCTAAKCAPGKVACTSNTLTKCNADGTDFEVNQPCGMGICDAQGGDCNMCMPGMKMCEGDMAATCDMTGQMFMPTPCPSGKHCSGMGQCVDCIGDDDCKSLTQGCKVGVCGTGNRCTTKNADSSTMCMASGGKPGTCSNGTCACTPQCAGRECGDNGCGTGATCGDCKGTEKCSKNQCVQCTGNGDCTSYGDGECKVGTCNVSTGTCSAGAASPGTRCSTSSIPMGTCSGQTCSCSSSCGSNQCNGTDSCGRSCSKTCQNNYSCGSNNTCEMNAPMNRAYEPCTNTPGVPTTTNGDRGSCASGLNCAATTNSGPHCYPAPPCNAGFIMLFGFCAPICNNPTGVPANCPAGLRCIAMFETDPPATQGYCVP